MRYFTSDWHLGSTLINKYAHRPFATASENAVTLVDNCNKVAQDSADVVFHVGDFWLNNADRHGNEEDVNMLTATYKDYIRFVSSRLVLLAGNHDDGHNCEADCKSMVLDLNQNYRDVSVSHYPSYHKLFTLPNDNCWKWFDTQKMYVHVHLCGHVHDKWLLNFDAQRKVLNVNVGVDVWNYKPVRDAEITELLDYFRATMWTKINPTPGKWTNFVLTRKALDEFKLAHSAEVKVQREARKQERYAKKGLTPEIREQKKQDGIKLSKIKKLRMMTGAGMGSCKDALDACGYDDLQKAKTWLVERGLNIAMKRKD